MKVLVTANEAWPELERTCLGATSEILMSFRLFDLRTGLLSDAGRAIGKDWFDLFAHILGRGVDVTLIVSDFDPVMATPLHAQAVDTLRMASALSQILPPDAGRLIVKADLHPARAGKLPWLAFIPFVLRRKRESLRTISEARLERGAVRLGDNSWPDLRTVSHHQKIAVIDGEWLYVGGLDTNPRRFDTPEHDRPARESWSDIQILVRGAAAREARQHILEFLDVVHGRADPTPMRWIRRTLSRPRLIQFPFLSPRTLLTEIEDTHLAAFEQAENLIYIETQYLRSTQISKGLARAARSNDQLRLIVVLPGLPDDVAFHGNYGLDARYGMELQKTALEELSDAFGDRALVTTPVQNRMAARETQETLRGSPLIHVHNKVLIVDDRVALVGSANLNGRSMHWDSEAALLLEAPEHIAQLRDALFAHWWFADLPDEARDPARLFPWWQTEVRRNDVARPENRSGFLVSHVVEGTYEMGTKLPGVTEDVV